MKRGLVSTLYTLASASLIAALHSPAMAEDICAPSEVTDPQPLHINGSTAYVYKTASNVQLRLHVFSSSGRKPGVKSPAVVMFYGGGFVFGEIHRFQTQATHLALQGIVTVLVDYRVRCRHDSTPMDSIADGKSAMRWVREHVGELNVDPDRIAALGSSAGGAISLATALISDFNDLNDHETDPRPNALILYNPGIDTGSAFTKRFFVEGLGFGNDTVARTHDMSPFEHLKAGLPPTIIFQGTADEYTPYSTAQTFCQRARALKSSCEVVTYNGAPHGFTEVWTALYEPKLGLNTEIWVEDTSRRTDAFLRKLGWLPQP